MLLLSFSALVKAQNQIEKSGTSIDNKETPHFSYVVGSDDKYFYTLWNDAELMNRKPTYTIYQINKTTLNSEKKVASLTLEKFCQFYFATKLKDKFYIFTKNLNSSYDKWQFTLNESTSGNNKSTILLEFKTDKNTFQRTAFLHCMSSDSSKMGIIAYHMGEVEFHLYDAYTFKKISSKKLSASTDLATFAQTSYIIDNEGNLFYIDNQFPVLNVTKQPVNNGQAVKTAIKIKSAYDMGEIKLLIDEKSNNIYVHSTFYEKNANSKISTYTNGGIYVAKIALNTLAVTTEKYHPFNQETMSKLICTPKAVLPNYSTNLILLNNSEILLEANQNSSASMNRGSNVGSQYDMSQKVYLFSNEIVVSKLTNDLQLSWMKYIPRNNTYTNITYDTESTILYQRLMLDNKVKYIFNEHPAFDKKISSYTDATNCNTPESKSYPGTNLVEYSLDMSGTIQKRVLLTHEGDSWLIPTFYNLNVGKDKYIVRFREKKNEHFSLINLK